MGAPLENTETAQREMSGMPDGDESGHKSFGPLIGIVIIIIILVAGGLYLWSEQSSSLESLSPDNDGVIDELQAQGTSDKVGDIEEDLDTTNLDNLDADLEAIESELGL